MKRETSKKPQYIGAVFVRMDAETARALREVTKLTERNQSDALRWSVRQMEKTLKSDSASVRSGVHG
jgi:hypothetical protein